LQAPLQQVGALSGFTGVELGVGFAGLLLKFQLFGAVIPVVDFLGQPILDRGFGPGDQYSGTRISDNGLSCPLVIEEREMMSEVKKRQVHTPEFKAKVGLEAVRGVKTINEIGQAYGVHPVQVGQWKKAIQEQAKTLFEGKRGAKPMASHQEPDQLYSEIGKLKMELDWLKKKSGMIPS